MTIKIITDLLKLALLIGLFLLQSDDTEILARFFGKYNYHAMVVIRLCIFLIGFDIIRVSMIRLYRRKIDSSIQQDNFILGLRHIYNLIVVIGLIITALALFKIDIRQFFISLAVFAAAIAITFKDYISNVINGMILTFSGDLSIGDYVKIGEYKGKIIDINLLNMHLLNDDDDLIYIPNNTVLNATILNYTKRETKKISIDFSVDLKHLDSVENLETEIIRSLSGYQKRIVPGSFRLKVEDIGKDYVSMKFQYILLEMDKDLEREIRRNTIRKVVELVKAH